MTGELISAETVDLVTGKPDDEFARINLSYFKSSGDKVVVFCPESKDASATQQPARRRLSQAVDQPGAAVEVQPSVQPAPIVEAAPSAAPPPVAPTPAVAVPAPLDLKEQHFTILYGDTGYSYRSLTAISNEISGTRWSGPAFFGLRDEAAKGAAK